jgi:hypothetical protein
VEQAASGRSVTNATLGMPVSLSGHFAMVRASVPGEPWAHAGAACAHAAGTRPMSEHGVYREVARRI